MLEHNLSENKKLVINLLSSIIAFAVNLIIGFYLSPYIVKNLGVEANGFIYVSGQLPINVETGLMPETIEEQTAQSLINIKNILEAAGSSMDNVVKTTVLMKNLGDFVKMNEVYGTFFKGCYPARAAYQVVALPKGAMVEIEAVATK